MLTCKFPLTGINCTQTYAEEIGRDYYLYHGIFIGSSVVTFVFTTIQLTRSFLFTESGRYQLQKNILSMSWLMSFFLLIQAIDPQGYRGVLPEIVESLAANLTTDIGLGILFVFIVKVSKVINWNSKEGDWWKIGAVVVVCISIIMTFLQVYINRSTFRGLKLILFALIISALTVRVDMLIKRVRKARSGNDLLRLDVYTGLFNVFVFFAVIYQLVSGSITIDRQLEEIPHLGTDAVIFPLLELVGILIATSYMSKIKHSERSSFNFMMPELVSRLRFSPHIGQAQAAQSAQASRATQAAQASRATQDQTDEGDWSNTMVKPL